jgi:broad specificity phosphatase PhoE
MKTIKFIRHNRLAAPYDDYSRLAFKEICGLATHITDPAIQNITSSDIAQKMADFVPDAILSSDSKRTVQTARIIAEAIGNPTTIAQSKNLREIYFDPSALIKDSEYASGGMPAVRTSLFNAMIDGRGAESITDIMKRIVRLEKELRNTKARQILCVTHSFYMRVLRLYFLSKITHPEDITPDLLLKTIDHDYLEGFEITLS